MPDDAKLMAALKSAADSDKGTESKESDSVSAAWKQWKADGDLESFKALIHEIRDND